MGIGLIMKLFQWPRPPLLLGIILGPIIEENFLSALSVVDALTIPIVNVESSILGVLTRPLTLGLLVVAIATAYLFARSSHSQTSVAPVMTDPEPSIAGGAGMGPARETLWEALWNIRNIPVLLAVGGGMAFFAGSMGFGVVDSWMLPRAMAAMVIILALVQLLFHLRQRGHQHSDIMDLGMHSLVLAGAKQAALLIGVGLVFFLILSGTVGLRWAVVALAGYLPFTLMARGGVSVPRATFTGAALGTVLAALMGTGVFAWLAEARLAGIGEYTAVGIVEAVIGGAAVAAAVAIGLVVDARGTATLIRPGPMVIVAATLVALASVLAVTGWPENPVGWLIRVGPCLAVLLLLFSRSVQGFQAPPRLGWLFTWRAIAPVITMSFVFLFEYILADNVLFIIWPEAALIDWFGEKVLRLD